MDDKITIIEGPPPVFEMLDDGWALGLTESPTLYELAMTRLRSYNSAELVERCHRTWNRNHTMFLHYRNQIGLEEKVPIMAARSLETKEGQMLFLWLRLDPADHSDDEPEDGPDLLN